MRPDGLRVPASTASDAPSSALPTMKVCALALTTVGVTLLAQPIVPVEQEPRHRTVFENAWVRVLDVNFEAGATSQFHRHALDNVAVRIVGGTTRADAIDAEGRAQRVADGSIVFHHASSRAESRGAISIRHSAFGICVVLVPCRALTTAVPPTPSPS